MTNLQLNLDPETQLVTVDDPTPTVSVIWDRAVQNAVIETAPGPTIASRAYAMVHTAIYDAWSAYEYIPISTNLGDDLQRPEAENTIANKSEAMSYSAYYVLVELFPEQKEIFARVMQDLGYDPDLESTDPTTPAGIGNITAQALLDYRSQDGANQLGDAEGSDGTPYSDYTGYQPINEPESIEHIDRWTPDVIPVNDSESITQEFLTPHWGNITPFALDSGEQFRPDAPQPFLLVDAEVDLEAKTITLEDGTVLDITPELVGTVINPEFIAQAEVVVEHSATLTDEEKMIAEFWEDAGGTSFPPGTWMTFGQYVSARDDNTLDEDAQMFFSLGNAVFDAGIATWESKVYYDYARPISVVRELGELGLIGEYDPDFGGYVIEAYGDYGAGTQTILATDFITYQTPDADYSPPFAEYTSGHSAFSAAGAEVLLQYTGSDDFGASVTFEPGESRFEPDITPTDSVTLEWDTFSEAADDAGISRLYGGIHFNEGDLNGRDLGREVGEAVFDMAQFYINGGDINQEEIILGTANPDVLFGSEAGDRIKGLENNDTINGLDGDDSLYGDEGLDLILGNDGNDSIYGGQDRDQLYGNQGDDLLDGGLGIDFLFGHQGNDIVLGGPGDDQIYGNQGDDLLDGGLGQDGIFSGMGNDQFVLRRGDGNDRFFDYLDGVDKFLLVDGLTFEELRFDYNNLGTQIAIAETNENLAIVNNIAPEALEESDFLVDL